jgi:hypothetical protein
MHGRKGVTMDDDRLSPDDAERILRDAAAGPRPGQPPLTAFLAATAAPSRDDELAGEEAAVAAFRQAHLERQARQEQRRRPRAPQALRRPVIARLLTVKVAVALALSATAVGGAALAAGTGTLPGPLGDLRPANQQSRTHGTTTSPPATRPATTQPALPNPIGGSEGSPTPSPSGHSSETNPGKTEKPKKSKKTKKAKKTKKPKKGKKPEKDKTTPPSPTTG